MYERVLDAQQVAGDLVDTLRATTDASLESCVEATKNLLATIGQFVKDDTFVQIECAVREYTVDVDNCYDSRLLSQVSKSLEGIFKEKEELSYSASQDDVMLIEYLRIYSDCTKKTDPRIPFRIISRDDFVWLGSMANLYQMDQNNSVRLAVLDALNVLCDRCEGILSFLLESNLPTVLASQIPSRIVALSEIELKSLQLLTKVYSSDISPPLDHFDIFTADLFEKLLHIMEFHPEDVLQFLVNFNAVVPPTVDNPVLLALTRCPRAMFGQVYIDQLNKQVTENRLKLLDCICSEGAGLLNDLFYSNDLEVLCRVLARELIDSEQAKIRRKCLEVIGHLAQLQNQDGTTRDAVSNCNLEDEEKNKVLDLLDQIS